MVGIRINNGLLRMLKKFKIIVTALLLFIAAVPQVIAQQSNYNQLSASKQKILTSKKDPQYEARTIEAANLCIRAKRFLDAKDYDAARQLYTQACKLDPHENSAAAHTNLGYVFQCLGNYDEAIPEFKKGMHFDPNMEITRTDLAFCLIKKQNCWKRTIG